MWCLKVEPGMTKDKNDSITSPSGMKLARFSFSKPDNNEIENQQPKEGMDNSDEGEVNASQTEVETES